MWSRPHSSIVALWSVTRCGYAPPTRQKSEVPRTETNKHQTGKTQHNVAQQGRSAELGHVASGNQHSNTHGIRRRRTAVLQATFHTSLGRDLTHVSVRMGTACSSAATLQLGLQILIPSGLALTRLPRSCVYSGVMWPSAPGLA